MDLKRLEVFCRTVEYKSFTRAAEVLLLSQPTVSEHIRHLEELLGEKLLDRLGREVLPTPAGRILYQYAQRMLRLKDEACQAIEHFRGNLAGHLALGASTIPGAYLLPRRIAAFKREVPSIQISLLISGTGNIERGLLQGDLELAIIGAQAKDARLECRALFYDEIVLAVPPDHPLARQPEVGVADLHAQDFLLRERASGTRAVTTATLREHGFDLDKARVVAELGSGEAIRESVKAGIGVAFISSLAVAEEQRRGTLAIVALKDFSLQRPFYLTHRRNRQLTPVAEMFCRHLEETAAIAK
ncbi:selenium metabolism-associated LysR family transcriptional regulator [Geoalkalibacter halelectricus]|uniref:LysR substrate-binding domain-containing protein n=1 Tax=Geoalkalibacter halelectricus TaxID=2847045 RepID=A0ABY5ZSC7_9BACT|nr:selenium metabolism-associated LysR family transcriptional regulator [Geoalkalibacter halelectricus]MDO3377398.1 selenium metabolism-associated LysR family transcriptional regulator [Geoalkalibacter halelectricus]UWZ80842.1 LysR substrate-binding domain-containing protein [Geoalkalibacter halelectricus]